MMMLLTGCLSTGTSVYDQNTGKLCTDVLGASAITTCNNVATNKPHSLYNAAFIMREEDSVSPQIVKSFFEKSANAGITEALFQLGSIYEDGYGVQADYQMAFDYYDKSAATGNIEALAHKAILEEQGKGVAKNIEQAISDYKIAASQGDSTAMVNLARIVLSNKKSSTNDKKNTVVMLEKAAKALNPEAMFMLGNLYMEGKTVKADLQKALKYYRSAFSFGYQNDTCNVYGNSSCFTSNGSLFSQFLTKLKANGKTGSADLAFFYENGFGVAKNIEMATALKNKAGVPDSPTVLYRNAMSIYNKASLENETKAASLYAKAEEILLNTAKYTSPEAIYQLGNMYLMGYLGSNDYLKAVAYFKSGVALGNYDSTVALGDMFARGIGVKKNFIDAMNWYRKANGRVATKSFEEVFAWYKNEANSGNAVFQYNLGRMYMEGKAVDRNEEEAVRFFRKSANNGLAAAWYELGLAYLNGNGVLEDHVMAVDCFDKAATKNDDKAMFMLAKLLYEGDGAMQDYQKAANWSDEAIKFGNKDALFLRGLMFLKGQGGAQDQVKGQFYLNEAVAHKSIYAMEELAKIYYYGKLLPVNYKESHRLSLLAAQNGSLETATILGKLLYTGKSGTKNYTESLYWFRQAAEHGDAGAAFIAASMYANGQGTAVDNHKALQYYHRVTEINNNLSFTNLDGKYSSFVKKDSWNKLSNWFLNNDKKADLDDLYTLGLMYENGLGVELSSDYALEYFQRAGINRKHELSAYEYADIQIYRFNNCQAGLKLMQNLADKKLGEALFGMGNLYKDGICVAQDYGAAMKYYLKASDKWHSGAMNGVGLLYDYGYGVPKNEIEAMKWFRKAADLKNKSAINNVGINYKNGTGGVEQNYDQALLWFQKSADLNFAPAMYRIGDMVSKGHNNYGWNNTRLSSYLGGLDPSAKEAVRWYKNAVSFGGYYQAEAALGDAYMNGKGVVANKVDGYAWYLLTQKCSSEFDGKIKENSNILSAEQKQMAEQKADQLYQEFGCYTNKF